MQYKESLLWSITIKKKLLSKLCKKPNHIWTILSLLVKRLKRQWPDIATNLDDAKTLYEDVYCARGDMENRIKEQQLA